MSPRLMLDADFVFDEQIYRRVLKEEVPATRHELIIASALVKQTRVESAHGIVPFCELLGDLVKRNVRVIVLFSGKPSRPFVDSLREFPDVLSGVKWRICPRNHMKVVLVDRQTLYLGSANLTGAGLGMKGKNKRNFEFGFVTKDRNLIARMSDILAKIINGDHCDTCGTKKLCRKEHESFGALLGLQA